MTDYGYDYDEPMTGPQRSYLHTLAREAGGRPVARPRDRRAAEVQGVAVAGTDQLDRVRVAKRRRHILRVVRVVQPVRLLRVPVSGQDERVVLVAEEPGGTSGFRLGGRIFVDDPSQIQQLNLNANSAMGFEEVQAYLGYIQQVSGASPYIAGSDASGYNIDNSTATGVNQLSSAAGRRIGFYIGQHQDAVARIGRQVIKLMNQFMTTERMVRIAGERGAEWVQLSPEDIPFDFDLIVKGSTESLNKSYERQQGIDLLREIASLNGLPSVDGRQFSIVPAVNYVVETFDLNPEEFWPQQDQHTQAQLQAQTDQATAGAQQAQADAQMADPQMQAMMQQQADPAAQQNPADDIQKKLFESISFKDMPADAQATMLQQLGLPTEGLAQQSQLDDQAQAAKIQQMVSQAASQNAGHDNAVN